MNKIEEIIKKSGIEEVDEETYAMLILIAYRAYLGTESQYYALFAYDIVDSCKFSAIKRIKEHIGSVLLHFIASLHSKGNRHEVTLISDNFLMSERYNDVISHLISNHRIVSYLNYVSFFGYLRSEKQKTDINRFKTRSVCVGSRICGHDFINLAMDIYDCFCAVASGKEENLSAEKISAFSEIIKKQINVIKKQLIRRNVRCFITINQYNVTDLLTIMACRKCGIVTKQMLHYSPVVFSTDYYSIMPHYCFTEVESMWNMADAIWARKYYKSINLLYDKHSFEVVGCPEIDRQKYDYYRKKYAREKSIILFAPGIGDYDVSLDYYVNHKDGKNVDAYVKWRRKIYDAVYDFAKRNHLGVYIRFHPGEENPDINLADYGYLDELSFKILSSSREDFYKAICSCQYAISMSSSAIYMALQYGCRCICIDEREKRDFCGLDIRCMKVNELHTYSDSSELEEKLTPDYFDEDKLLDFL